MVPGDAIHGAWCNSRTYPTRCRYCGEDVFFFSCSCGSKVFFDSLGPPWPLHDCLERKRAEFGTENVERAMAIGMMLPGIKRTVRIEKTYSDKVTQSRPRQPQIMRMDAYANAGTQEQGVVREYKPEVDLFKKFSIEIGTIGAASLRSLGTGKFAQITIHTGGIAGEDNPSFTFFASHKILQRKSIVTGDLIQCNLRGVEVLGNGVIWVCDKIEML